MSQFTLVTGAVASSAGNSFESPGSCGRQEAARRLVFPFAGGAESGRRSAARGICDQATVDVTHVYNLAADMGGMGFVENNKALCMLSVLINTHMLMAARKHVT